MSIAENRQGDWLVLAPSGALTHETERDFVKTVLERFDSGQRKIVVDLAAVNYVSSAGLSALVRVTAQANSQGMRLVLARASMFVSEVVATTRLDRFFEMYPTLEAATGSG